MSTALLERRKHNYLVVILVVFYTVGLCGLMTVAYRPWFLSLSFFNLLLSFTVLCVSLGRMEVKTTVFMGVFVVEMGIITEGKYRLNLKQLKKQRALYGREKPDGKLGHK